MVRNLSRRQWTAVIGALLCAPAVGWNVSYAFLGRLAPLNATPGLWVTAMAGVGFFLLFVAWMAGPGGDPFHPERRGWFEPRS